MKRALAIVMAVFFVCAVASLSFAVEEKKAAPAPAAEKAVPAPTKMEETKAPVKVKMVEGDVTAVDAKAKTITVKGKKGDVVIAVDDKMMADIKAGDKVFVKYTETDGKNVAKSVRKAKAQPVEKMMEKPAVPPKAVEKPAEKK